MRFARPTILVALLVVGLGCSFSARAGRYEDEKKKALAALDVFHQRLSAREFEAIYAEASHALRQRPKGELVAAMSATHDTWGKFVSAEVKSSSCFPGEVRFVVEATFEKGVAGEMIIWHMAMPNGEPRLQHFQIYPGPAVVAPPGSANECRSRDE